MPRGMRHRAAAGLFTAVSILVSATGSPAADVGLVTRDLPFRGANDPVAFDFDFDGRYELVVSSADGGVAAYHADGLREMWQRKLSGRALTQPAIGDFRGDGSLQVGVASAEGAVVFLDAMTGDPVASADLRVAVTLAPTVVPLKGLDGSARDALIVCDDNGSVRLVAVDGEGARQVYEIPNTVDRLDTKSGLPRRVTIGRITCPATAADVTGDGVPEIIVGTVNGAVQAVPLNRPEQRYLWFAAQGTRIGTGICVADFFGAGQPKLVLGTQPGDLFVLEFDAASAGFREVRRDKLLGAPNGPLFIADFDGDGIPDLAGASAESVVGFEGGAMLSRFEKPPFTTITPPLSPITLARSRGGKPAVLVTDGKKTVSLLDPREGGEVARASGRHTVENLCPAGDLTGGGRIEFAYLAEQRRRLCLARMETYAEKDWPAVLCYGATFQRDGQVTTASMARVAAYRERSDAAVLALVSQAQLALKAGKKNEAAGSARRVLTMRPGNAGAAQVLASATRGANLLRYAVGGILALGAAFFGWRAWGAVASRRGLRNRAERLTADRNYPVAAEAWRAVLARSPGDQHALVALADCLVRADDHSPGTADVLRRARTLQPDNPELTVALAQTFAEQGTETDEALDAYLVALGTLEFGRGRIAFHTANVLRARGDNDKAQRYYRLALKEGFVDPVVYHHLSDIFIETGQFSDKTLPAFEEVRHERWEDARFMEGYCRSLAAARRADPGTALAAERLLALQPDNPAGLRLLARCELQAGRAAKAAQLAEQARITSSSPEPELLEFLSHCYLAQERGDPAAVAIYREALKVSADQPDLLRAVAGAILDGGGGVDDESYAMLRRASAANPQDVDLLLGVAGVAAGRGEHDVVTYSLEHALSLGHESQDLFCKLAEAYSSTSSDAPAAERVFREALKTDPENAAFLRGLARVLIRQQRSDPDTMLLLERAFQKDNSDIEMGRQLARVLMKNGRFEETQKLVRWLLQFDKENEELQKLFAQASLNNNRLDEAVKQYEHLLRQHPDDAEANVNLAVALAEKQRTDDEAAARYERALAFEPDNDRIRLIYARHHALAGRVARAVEEFRRTLQAAPRAEKAVLEEVRVLIAASPERADLRWFLANALIEAGSHSEAIEQLEAVFELDPGQMKPVLQAYDRILARDPNSVAANLQKGVLLKAQGRFEEARAFLQRAYQLSPGHADGSRELAELYDSILAENDDVEVRFQLGKLHYTQGDHDKAIACFQKTQQDFRYENESIKMLGLCFAGKGMLDFALNEFKKLVIDGELKEILYDLAQRYESANKLVGAKDVYKLLFAADIAYKDVKRKFEMLAGSTSDPMALESSQMMTQLSERARKRYELLQEIGRGAMGIVYKARDNELEEDVALKILPENLSQNPEALSRFRSEARSARRLSHPHIVRIHDIGEELGRKYISMEYVQGTDLKRYFRMKGKLDPAEVARLITPVAAALHYAHASGVVHRDIKPANIMLNENLVPKVSDFGIAKLLESTGETLAGAIIGTPLYMSPEQVEGTAVDGRADIYSLGVMMYELATGRPPFFEGDLSYQHVKVEPKPPEGVPEPLASIIMKCLAKDRDQRWASAEELQKALEQVTAG